MTYNERLTQYMSQRQSTDELAAMTPQEFSQKYDEFIILKLGITNDDFLDAAIEAAKRGDTTARERVARCDRATKEARGMTLMAIDAIENGDEWFIANT